MASLVLAVMLHAVGLMAAVAYSPNQNPGDGFFSSMPDVKLQEVHLTTVVMPPPKPPPPRVQRHQPQPQRVYASAPTVPHPTRPGRPNAHPGGGPRVLTNRRTAGGYAVRQGSGGLGVGYGDRGNGSGYASGYAGPPNGGPGGAAPPAPPPSDRGTVDYSVKGEYDNVQMCGLPHSAYTRPVSKGTRDWESACRSLGVSWDELRGRASVRPFLVSVTQPSAYDEMKLAGRSGTATLQITIHSDCTISVQVSTRSGDEMVDRLIYAYGMATTWLPALRNGQPVEDSVEYTVSVESRPASHPGAPH